MYIDVIVVKDGVHINTYYDKHEQLLKQLNIEDTIENRGVKFVKVRVECANWDIFDSINQINAATIEVKQYEIPAWFSRRGVNKRIKEAFKDWHKEHVFVDQEIDELLSGFYCLKNCKVECLYGDVEIELCDGCQIECVSGEATIKDCFNGNINIMLDKASIWWSHKSQINEMFDESSVGSSGGSETIVKRAYENSQLEDEDIKLQYDYRNKEES